MTGRVIWHELAEQDLAEAYLFIGEDSLAAAERLLDALEATVQFLLGSPGAGRKRRFASARAKGIRSWAVSGFPSYLIFYRLDGKDLEVVRFVHGARDLPRLLEDDSAG